MWARVLSTENPPDAVDDTLAPIIHWRVCHVWDWLTFFAPQYGFRTSIVAEIYGGDEAQETNARTGCVGCNLVSEDKMLARTIALPDYMYLAPLQRLHLLYVELLKHTIACAKMEASAAKMVPFRKAPSHWPTHHGCTSLWACSGESNSRGNHIAVCHWASTGFPGQFRRREPHSELIEANTWADGWTGEEPRGGSQHPAGSDKGFVCSANWHSVLKERNMAGLFDTKNSLRRSEPNAGQLDYAVL